MDEKMIMWIVIAVVAVILIVLAVLFIVKIAKMKPEERKELLKTYLKGAIALAEQQIVGEKKGAEKLAAVEEYFKKNAPFLLKVVLMLTGKKNLQALIEEGLSEIKESFK